MVIRSEQLFYDNVEDALCASIQALGGAKQVASDLWPDKPVEEARNLLLNCINPGRKEKLDYTQLMWVFRQAKRAGFVAGFVWFSRACEFEAKAVAPEQEIDRLTAVVEQSTKTLTAALATLERIKNGS